MRFSNLLTLWVGVLLILSVCLWSSTTAQSDVAADCCLATSDRRIPYRVVTSFTIQTADGACKIPSTVFVTKRGFKLCAPFPSDSTWVTELIDAIISGPKPKKPKGRKQRKL